MALTCKRFSTSQMIILGYAGVIFLGTVLLMLPIATADGQGAPFLTALFTATSALSVTGLVVKNTATYWSLFGQGVIISLIQIGGMGVITVAIGLSLLRGRRIGLKQRRVIQDALAAPQVGGIIHLTRVIIYRVALVEALGALVLLPGFVDRFGLAQGLWYSGFHAISAFCNAGFDLFGTQTPYASLTAFADSPVVNLVIMTLIIIGGLGFLTWEDILTQRFKVRRYKMQTKVVLFMTGLLVLLPALYFFMYELADFPLQKRLWAALFQSVTTRTAGFNTINLGLFSGGGLMIMTLLMLVGGGPGSTAGGMKVTTPAVLYGMSRAVFKRERAAHLFHRRIPVTAIHMAVAIFCLYTGVCLLGGFFMFYFENLPLLKCLFECASAIGTVGLTLGITPDLTWVSHVILIILMFVGRVGAMTFMFATFSQTRDRSQAMPEEKINIG
ncbi:TrkH family potassium uptake protein [Peptococcus simiae]|uniref:TrkH family potassium uptake protein n=1 Tax=Peptococcus simiae TaxID=1643805 RepID=UPI00397F6170